jgi:hypothetical protein
MTFLLALIAIAGIAAVVLRWSSAMFVTARHSIEWFVAGQIAQSRAQRGDISGMSEAAGVRARYRKDLLRSLARLGLWSAALLVLLLPGLWILIAACYNVFWFLPRQRIEISRA